MDKKIIGRHELISILDLELFDLDAKIDTGADTSALHCNHLEIDKKNNTVSFSLLDKVHEAYHGKRLTLPLHKIKKVKSSNGQIQYRPSVKVNILFMGEKYKTIISLTDRTDMIFPMLIGRSFLKDRFIVDVSQDYVTREV